MPGTRGIDRKGSGRPCVTKGRKLTPEQREKAIKNLNPVKKGEVRNPTGKTNVSLTSALKHLIEQEIKAVDPLLVAEFNKGGKRKLPEATVMTVRELINRALVKNAIMGELPSIESVYRKIDGSPDQIIQNFNQQMEDDDSEILEVLSGDSK